MVSDKPEEWVGGERQAWMYSSAVASNLRPGLHDRAATWRQKWRPCRHPEICGDLVLQSPIHAILHVTRQNALHTAIPMTPYATDPVTLHVSGKPGEWVGGE